MKNNKTTALLMLLVFLLVAAVVIIFLTGLDNSSRRNPSNNVTTVGDTSVNIETPTPTPTPAVTSVPTAAPTYYPATTYAPTSTARPVSTATPPPKATPTPTPSAAPSASSGDLIMLPADELIPATPKPSASTEGTATLIPTGTSLGSGSFRSDTGASINIHADWSATVSGDRTVEVTVTVYCDSYSLHTTASPEALNIGLDGQYLSLASPAIDYDGTSQISTQINRHSFTVNLGAGESRTVPLEVSWLFRGTYGGMEIETIDCGGNISLSR